MTRSSVLSKTSLISLSAGALLLSGAAIAQTAPGADSAPGAETTAPGAETTAPGTETTAPGTAGAPATGAQPTGDVGVFNPLTAPGEVEETVRSVMQEHGVDMAQSVSIVPHTTSDAETTDVESYNAWVELATGGYLVINLDQDANVRDVYTMYGGHVEGVTTGPGL
jgi:hypothetical protein